MMLFVARISPVVPDAAVPTPTEVVVVLPANVRVPADDVSVFDTWLVWIAI